MRLPAQDPTQSSLNMCARRGNYQGPRAERLRTEAPPPFQRTSCLLWVHAHAPLLSFMQRHLQSHSQVRIRPLLVLSVVDIPDLEAVSNPHLFQLLKYEQSFMEQSFQ